LKSGGKGGGWSAKYLKMAKVRGIPVRRYGDGNHISPRAKVIEINGHHIEAWIYRGGHGHHVLELIARECISSRFDISDGDTVHLRIEHFPEGKLGMPKAPPLSPGQAD